MDDQYAGHKIFASKAEVPYKHLDILGRGNYGLVDKVESIEPRSGSTSRSVHGRGNVYARKIIRVGYFWASKQHERIMSEISIVRRLKHCHIVELVETYQAGLEFGIIMSPVAEMDLGEFLAHAHKDGSIWTPSCLDAWTECLIGAVRYIHSQRVRHKDLKPANILVRGRDIFVTDFGIAKDLVSAITTGTTGEPSERTPMYCAPESNVEGERRGRSADMFSLGCIMLEMLTILMGDSLARFEEYRNTNGSHAYAANHQKVYMWIIQLLRYFPRRSPDIYYYRGNSLCLKLATVAALLDPVPEYRPRSSELNGCNGHESSMSLSYYKDSRPQFVDELRWIFKSPDNGEGELPEAVRDGSWLVRPYLFQREEHSQRTAPSLRPYWHGANEKAPVYMDWINLICYTIYRPVNTSSSGRNT